MLSLPDFEEKQVLFVCSDEGKSYQLKLHNDNVQLFDLDGNMKKQLSCYKVFALFIIGDLTITTKIIRRCSDFGIGIYFLKQNFDHYATIPSDLTGNYVLRHKQYSFDTEQEFKMAQWLIINKVENQLKLLKDSGYVDKITKFKQTNRDRILALNTNQELLGVEGTLAKQFYGCYFKDINWYRRSPRTKVDINNYLLDIGYTFLFNYVDALLSVYGFDTYKGFYHQLYFQRRSLSCDVMEPMRCIIDKVLLKSFNLGQINEKDFILEKGAYRCDFGKINQYTKLFFQGILEYKIDIFNYIKEFYRYSIGRTDKFPKFDIRS